MGYYLIGLLSLFALSSVPMAAQQQDKKGKKEAAWWLMPISSGHCGWLNN